MREYTSASAGPLFFFASSISASCRGCYSNQLSRITCTDGQFRCRRRTGNVAVIKIRCSLSGVSPNCKKIAAPCVSRFFLPPAPSEVVLPGAFHKSHRLGAAMPNSRRKFLADASLGLVATAATLNLSAAAHAETPAQAPPPNPQSPKQTPPAGAPPAFGTAPAVGPEVTTATFAEAEKLVQFPLTEDDRAQAAGNWRNAMAPLYERRVGPRKVAIPTTTAPYSTLGLHPPRPTLRPRQQTSSSAPQSDAPLPTTDEAIAFAPVHHLSRWIETRKLTSERLTNIYLNRIEQFNPKLNCIITLTRDHALAASQSQPTPKSPPATTAAHSTASPGAQKTSSTPPTSPPPTAPSPSATASPPPTPPSPSASTPPAPSSSPSSPSAPSPSTTSGSAARP